MYDKKGTLEYRTLRRSYFPVLQIWRRFRLQEKSWGPQNVCCQRMARPRIKRAVDYPALKPERCQPYSGGQVSISVQITDNT